jgi:hypothetical protein
MDIRSIRIATAAASAAAAIAFGAAPAAQAAPSPLPKVCVMAGEVVVCPSPAPPALGDFPEAVRLYPYGYPPVPVIGHR